MAKSGGGKRGGAKRGAAKGSGGSKGISKQSVSPNWPSKTGKRSGKGRGNNPPKR